MSIDTLPIATAEPLNPIDERELVEDKLFELESLEYKSPEQLLSILALQRYLLHTDALTGLLNKNGAEDSYKKLLEQSEQESGQKNILLVYSIDVNGFSDLNSGLTHVAGDLFLILLAEELSKRFRDSSRQPFNEPIYQDGRAGEFSEDAVCSRVKGDEFLVMLMVPYASFNDQENGENGNPKDIFKKRIDDAFEEAKKRTIKHLEEQAKAEEQAKSETQKNSQGQLDTDNKDKQQNDAQEHKTETIEKEFTVIDSLTQTTTLLSFKPDSFSGDNSFDIILEQLAKKPGHSSSELGAKAVRAAQRLISGLLPKNDQATDLKLLVIKRKNAILKLEDDLGGLIDMIDVNLLLTDPSYIKSLEALIDIEKEQISKIISLSDEYEDAIDTDRVTGLKNRHWLERTLARILKKGSNTEKDTKRSELAKGRKNFLLMIDLASFGGVNRYNDEEYGAGDIILQQFSQILYTKYSNFAKKYGIKGDVVRTGGDEFHIVLEDVDLSYWLDERIIDEDVMIKDAEQHFLAMVQQEIFKSAEAELLDYLHNISEIYPNFAIHTGNPTEIIFDENISSLKDIIKKLIQDSEVKKRDKSGRLKKMGGVLTALGGNAMHALTQ